MTKALMTIHGFLTDIYDFGELYDGIADMYDHIHKCKVPGHNDKVDFKQFTVSQTIDTVLNDFDNLQKQYDQVDVVGFSMGGALTTYLCARRPVHKAVLLAPSNKYNNHFATTKSVAFYYNQYIKLLNNCTGTLGARLREAQKIMQQYRNNSVVATRIALRRLLPNLSVHTYSVFKELMSVCNKALDDSGEQGIDTPTLLLWGELDELVPRKSLDHIKSYFANIKSHYYSDIGHAMMLSSRAKSIIFDMRKFLAD